MSREEHRRAAPERLVFASLTVSDSRTPESDRGGRTVRELAAAAAHEVRDGGIVPDSEGEIRAAVEGLLADPGVEVLVVTGGTGVAPRDVTVEAVEPLLERRLDGFGELFRMLSYEEVGPAAMLSRATAGIARGKPVFLLPGSPAAARLAMERLILPEAGHLVAQVRGG